MSFPTGIHFISGLPRSGSTLLAALLRQNPQFHAGMSSPVGHLVNQMREAMSNNENAVLISDEQKQDILTGLFKSYYRAQLAAGQTIFDTNRVWCSQLPLLHSLFPEARVICCVRNPAWIMDSLERLVRRNALNVSAMFNHRGETATVYSRTEALGRGDRFVGFAYDALREAFYGDLSHKLLLVDYDLFTQKPQQAMSLIYQFLDLPAFEHDFEQVDYAEPKFDAALNTPDLHTVRRKVEFVPRPTILPPDLFERYSQLAFWQHPTASRASVLCARPQSPSQ
jgi:sulfotransferase